MDRKSLDQDVSPMPKEGVTLRAIAVLSAFVAVFAAICLLAPEIASMTGLAGMSDTMGITREISYGLMAALGFGMAVIYRKNVGVYEGVMATLGATIVWLAIESRYWFTILPPADRYFEPFFGTVVTFLVMLGSIALLKSEKVLLFSTMEDRYHQAIKSLGTGALIGTPFAITIGIFALFVYRMPIVVSDVLYQVIIAAGPTIMSDFAFRLLLMGVTLVVLRRYLPMRLATGCALTLVVAFQIVVHVLDMGSLGGPYSWAVSALMAAVIVVLLVYITYRRDIETTIGFHFVINIVLLVFGLQI